MSGGGEHLKDEVPRITRPELVDTMLIDCSGISTASSSRRSNCGSCLKVETHGHRIRSGRTAESHRSCIAPLDVLKIRLQLQIHSLSDPSSSRCSARAARYGIGNTFKNILRDEGMTVGPDQGVESAAGH